MESARPPLLLFICLCALIRSGDCIDCYQCNSTDLDSPFQCLEYLTSDIDIQPRSCDEVYNAAYCIKHTGRFEGHAIKCIVCSGDCTSPSLSDCHDIFEASFCIKESSTTKVGGVGTRRYCSSVDMGNYCNYIRQPGDTKEYRSCVFTCDSDGCNAAVSNHLSAELLAVFVASVLIWRL